MASSLGFTQFVCEQIDSCGSVKYKKMFGEFTVYLNDKPIFLICDDTLFVKINDVSTNILGAETEQGYPYDGAKIRYVVTEVDDKNLMESLALALEKITPFPKAKKKNQIAK